LENLNTLSLVDISLFRILDLALSPSNYLRGYKFSKTKRKEFAPALHLSPIDEGASRVVLKLALRKKKTTTKKNQNPKERKQNRRGNKIPNKRRTSH